MEKAAVRIDGVETDPCRVIAGAETNVPATHRIEVDISAEIFLREMQQRGAKVSEESLRDFVAEDFAHELARRGYLKLVRQLLVPLPEVKPGQMEPEHALNPAWEWTESSGVELREGMITIRGKARKL